MSANSEDGNPVQRRDVRGITELIDQFQNAIREYDHSRRQEGHHDTEQGHQQFVNSNLGNTMINNMDTAFDGAFRKLSTFIKDDLYDEYWTDEDIEWPRVEWPPGVSTTTGIQALERLPDPTRNISVEVTDRHKKNDVKTQTVLLVPFQTYERIHKLLDECRLEIGFAAETRKRTRRTQITRDDLVDVEKWRMDTLGEDPAEGWLLDEDWRDDDDDDPEAPSP